MRAFSPRDLAWPTIAAAVLIGVFAAAYIVLAWHNFQTFKTGHDLAGYTQALHHLTAGRLPYNSFKEQVMWGDHAHFVLVLLTPLFSFFPDARTLLAIQALAATTAGWALYRFAMATIKHSLIALALLYTYLSFVGLQYALNFDFHSITLTGAAIAWLLYAYHFKKWPLYWTMLVIGLATREDAPLIFFMIGMWQILTRRVRVGFYTVAISATYFLVVAYLLMPLWTPNNAILPYLDTSEKDPISVIHSIVTNPVTILQNITDTEAKRHTLHTLVQSLAYAPLFSPFTYLSSAPLIYARFNSPNEYRWLLTNHSNAHIHPLLVFGALFGLINLRRLIDRTVPPRLRQRAALKQSAAITVTVALLVATHITAWQDPAIPLRQLWHNLTTPQPDVAATATAFNTLKNLIPPQASVTASSGFTAHFAHHSQLKYFSTDPLTTDWVIVSPHVNPWPFNRDQALRAITQLHRHPDYQLIAEESDTALFQRVAPKP